MKVNREIYQLAREFMYKYGMSLHSALDLACRKVKEKERIVSLCQQARENMENWFKLNEAKRNAEKIGVNK